jgi:hypothetical protein
LAGRRAAWAGRARHRTDGGTSGVLSAHHHRAGKHNNVLALAFGVLIVFVVVAGSMWIMADMSQNMVMPSATPMSMRMQH